MSKRLQDSVALITGGGGALGSGIASKFASEGCKVAICDVDEAAVQQVAKEINQAGGSAWASVVDIAKEDQVKTWCSE